MKQIKLRFESSSAIFSAYSCGRAGPLALFQDGRINREIAYEVVIQDRSPCFAYKSTNRLPALTYEYIMKIVKSKRHQHSKYCKIPW